MRLIGHLKDEASARTFSDYLFVRGIDNQIELGGSEGWSVWVNEEEKIEEAAKLLAAFLANPSDPAFRVEAEAAGQLRAERAKDETAWRRRLRNRRHLFRPLSGYGFGPLTFVLIAISVTVFILTKFGDDRDALQSLFITQFMSGGHFVLPDPSLPEIRHGQIWRLFTPIFIHFGAIHILCNMLWLRDLGSMIEGRQTSLHLALLTLVIAAGSNLAQFYFGHAPNFGGMSGVVYGLLGYVWIRGNRDPGSCLFLHRSTVSMMLIWLVACIALKNLVPIANTAHVAGLVMGMAWGWLSSLRFH